MSAGESFFGRLRSAFGGEPADRNGRRVVARNEAAVLCAQALRRVGVLGVPHAPRGDAGRVAVVLALVSPKVRASLGWIEIPLTGEVVLTLAESSVAATFAAPIQRAVAEAFSGVVVRPVPADARTWSVAGRRVSQMANGLWSTTGHEGALLAISDTPEEAVGAAQSLPATHPGARPTSSEGDAAGMLVEMEREHAARWIAKQLREHGYEARAEAGSVALTLPAGGARMRVGLTGLDFDDAVPALARSVGRAALRHVGVVERLG